MGDDGLGGLQKVGQAVANTLADKPIKRLMAQYPELTKTGILAVEYDHNRQKFYLGTTLGLWVLDLNAEQVAKYSEYRQLDIGYVNAVHIDNNGDVWFGSGGLGLMLLSGNKEVLIRFNEPQAPSAGLLGDYVTTLLRDGRNLWVGTRSNGLSRCQIQPLKCTTIEALSGQASHFNITSITKLRNGNIMYATRGGGAFEASHTGTQNVHFTVEQGLSSNIVLAIEEDSDGSVWLATAKGLSRLSQSRQEVVNYPIDELVGASQFNAHASTQNNTHLFFGGLQGVVRINKHTQMPTYNEHPLILGAKITEQQRTRVTNTNNALSVGPRSIVELDFALLDYALGTKEYEYRLNTHEPWQAIGTTHQFLLHHLSAGQYQIQVRSRDFAGRWQHSKPLFITVTPHWWQTTWFALAVFGSVFAVMWWWHTMRTQKLHQRNQGLLRLQELKQRTKEQERQHLSRELHDEIGQNLTACKLGLQMLNLQNDGTLIYKQVTGSVSLLDKIIMQTRDLTQSLRPPMLDELGLYAALSNYIADVKKRTAITISLNLEPDIESRISAHAELVFRVVQESVNNALKHAQATKIAVTISADNAVIILRVSDDGVGIDLKSIERCIRSGKHLGLLGMRERLHHVDGNLHIGAGQRNGCVITARIPFE